MLEETIAALDLRPRMAILDATLGGGEAAQKLLEAVTPGGVVVGIDRDPDALAAATARMEGQAGFIPAAGNFRDLERILREAGLEQIDGALFDLGVSSWQLDAPERGFSCQHDGPLSMRMGPDADISAAEVVNGYPEAELARIFREKGDERFARRIAARIVARRKVRAFRTTLDLAGVVSAAMPPTKGPRRIHPATRVFLALRAEVNQEYENLAAALPAAVEMLKPGGRLAVVAFHSIEDRLAKVLFRQMAGRCQCPPGLPACNCGARRVLEILTGKPIRPSAAEVARNPRARSARLRVVQKLA